MRDLAVLFVHLTATVVKVLRPGGARSVVAARLRERAMAIWNRFGLLAVAAIAVTAPGATADVSPVPPFAIEVTITETGASMRCLQGCAWETTAIGCGNDTNQCSFVLDYNGVG